MKKKYGKSQQDRKPRRRVRRIERQAMEQAEQVQILGVRQGATENAAVCSALLEDLRERGVTTDVLLDNLRDPRLRQPKILGHV